MRARVPTFVLLLASAPTGTALAQAKTSGDELARLSGMAEFGIGALSLPAAKVCTSRTSGHCKQGDTSLMLEAWQLLRTSRGFAAGAGITLGLFPVADVPPNVAPNVERDHKRSYFTAEGILRWYFYGSPQWEAWVGLTGGLVVIADTYSSKEALTEWTLPGPRGVTTRTEGFTLGCALGISRPILGDWSLGANIRYGFWNLPKEPARSPFGDEASLVARNSMFLIGLSVGYRITVY
ncbi:MAG TPA: hypothetical protein VKP30_10910 [Polyangiaceae bacterium]|nr:hypothetical protein [Polyangiaceae bacterium]